MVEAREKAAECVWGEGHHVFVVENLVLPRERETRATLHHIVLTFLGESLLIWRDRKM